MRDVRRVVRREVHHALRCGSARSTGAITHHIHPVLEADTPSADWLRALLCDDPMVLETTPDRWVRVDAVLDGRVLSVAVDDRGLHTASGAMGDIGVLLRRYPGWARLPAVHDGRRVMLEVQWPEAHTPRLSWSSFLPSGIVGVKPGPEGISVRPIRIDDQADADLVLALRIMSSITGRGQPGNLGPPTDLQTVYGAIATDRTLLRRATRPLGEVLPTLRSSAA